MRACSNAFNKDTTLLKDKTLLKRSARQNTSSPEGELEENRRESTTRAKQQLTFWQSVHPRHFFLDAWRQIDVESVASREARAAPQHFDWGPLITLACAAAFLSALHYFGMSGDFYRIRRDVYALFGTEAPRLGRFSKFGELYGYLWWGACCVSAYMLLPCLVLRLRKQRIMDYHLSIHGLREHFRVYLSFLAVMLPTVVVLSFGERFSSYYPFYSKASRSWFDFGVWELTYAAQFFALEFFFRGFLLQGCRKSMGSQAIFAAVVPYCMIHFGKPFLETIAAIIAGIILGTLAMRTRSIWGGFMVHVGVALSMDTAAILQGPGLPTQLWP